MSTKTHPLAKTALILSVTALVFAAPATGKVTTGNIAPDVQVIDSYGDIRTLGEFRNQNVVLEWTNHKCPYVKKHYDSNNMQNVQKYATKNDFAWLSIISSAPGKQGHVDGAKANELSKKREASPTAILLDEDGKAGRTYEAKTTPHMYVLTADTEEGAAHTLAYQGAIDSNSSVRKSTINGATNYVVAAIDAIKAGQAIEVSESQPYGCSVKY